MKFEVWERAHRASCLNSHTRLQRGKHNSLWQAVHSIATATRAALSTRQKLSFFLLAFPGQFESLSDRIFNWIRMHQKKHVFLWMWVTAPNACRTHHHTTFDYAWLMHHWAKNSASCPLVGSRDSNPKHKAWKASRSKLRRTSVSATEHRNLEWWFVINGVTTIFDPSQIQLVHVYSVNAKCSTPVSPSFKWTSAQTLRCAVNHFWSQCQIKVVWTRP